MAPTDGQMKAATVRGESTLKYLHAGHSYDRPHQGRIFHAGSCLLRDFADLAGTAVTRGAKLRGALGQEFRQGLHICFKFKSGEDCDSSGGRIQFGSAPATTTRTTRRAGEGAPALRLRRVPPPQMKRHAKMLNARAAPVGLRWGK